MIPVVLTVAGSDPAGGAGIQADLKTFHQFRCYGMSVITLVTVQNTQRTDRVVCLEPALVCAQLRAVTSDIRPYAAKTGALGREDVIRTVAGEAAKWDFPLVVDPVMVSKHGVRLMDEAAEATFRRELLPAAYVVMPNRYEATRLAGIEVCNRSSAEAAARAIARLGPHAVLIKGGHLEEDRATDYLWDGKTMETFTAPRYATTNTHGIGCVYSAAVVAGLATGRDLVEAVRCAKAFVTEAIRTNPRLGSGCGPVNFLAEIKG